MPQEHSFIESGELTLSVPVKKQSLNDLCLMNNLNDYSYHCDQDFCFWKQNGYGWDFERSFQVQTPSPTLGI